MLQSISQAIPNHVVETFSSLDGLSERLQRPMPGVRVAVLYASDRRELMDIVYLGCLLSDLKVVLVFPDSDPDMLEKAFALCPRFIAATESDFRHLGAILKKMMN